jgi:hypothetical protein
VLKSAIWSTVAKAAMFLPYKVRIRKETKDHVAVKIVKMCDDCARKIVWKHKLVCVANFIFQTPSDGGE